MAMGLCCSTVGEEDGNPPPHCGKAHQEEGEVKGGVGLVVEGVKI